MRRFGILPLTQGQLWRTSADLGTRLTCVFATAATRTMLSGVADPSSKMSATDCQNRYPSPSKRSDLSQVGPHSFPVGENGAGNVITGSAECGQAPKKAFAPALVTSQTVAAKQFRLREGSLSCLKRPGLSLLSQWSGLPPVWTMIPSVGLPALPVVRSLLTRWVAMPLSVPSSVVAQVCSATTWVSVTNQYSARLTARHRTVEKAIGAIAPVVFFFLPTGGHEPARLT